MSEDSDRIVTESLASIASRPKSRPKSPRRARRFAFATARIQQRPRGENRPGTAPASFIETMRGTAPRVRPRARAPQAAAAALSRPNHVSRPQSFFDVVHGYGAPSEPPQPERIPASDPSDERSQGVPLEVVESVPDDTNNGPEDMAIVDELDSVPQPMEESIDDRDSPLKRPAVSRVAAAAAAAVAAPASGRAGPRSSWIQQISMPAHATQNIAAPPEKRARHGKGPLASLVEATCAETGGALERPPETLEVVSRGNESFVGYVLLRDPGAADPGQLVNLVAPAEWKYRDAPPAGGLVQIAGDWLERSVGAHRVVFCTAATRLVAMSR